MTKFKRYQPVTSYSTKLVWFQILDKYLGFLIEILALDFYYDFIEQ